MTTYLGWTGIMRLGLVQSCLGAIVILMTSTFNRVMVVELNLAAAIPGFLVGLHYAVQMSRPRWGYGADTGGRRTAWITAGMTALAAGAVAAAAGASLVQDNLAAGLAICILAFTLIGAGVGASGTNLLALLAIRTAPAHKAAAAAIVWIMMIAGFIITAGIAGALLKPFTFDRLIYVTAGTGLICILLTSLCLIGLDRVPAGTSGPDEAREEAGRRGTDFRHALAEIWDETQARRFTVFVFVSMLAYSAQDLILEPFAGLVHGYSAGASTQLSGIQNAGTLTGMIVVALAGTIAGKARPAWMQAATIAGCLASGASLMSLSAGAAIFGPAWPLVANVFALGLSNGIFAVSAIGSMMVLASSGRSSREGTRMGLWGAAQALAFALGGLAGAVGLDLARLVFADVSAAFAVVFGLEGLVFMAAAWLAARIDAPAHDISRIPVLPAGSFRLSEGEP